MSRTLIIDSKNIHSIHKDMGSSIAKIIESFFRMTPIAKLSVTCPGGWKQECVFSDVIDTFAHSHNRSRNYNNREKSKLFRLVESFSEHGAMGHFFHAAVDNNVWHLSGRTNAKHFFHHAQITVTSSLPSSRQQFVNLDDFLLDGLSHSKESPETIFFGGLPSHNITFPQPESVCFYVSELGNGTFILRECLIYTPAREECIRFTEQISDSNEDLYSYLMNLAHVSHKHEPLCQTTLTHRASSSPNVRRILSPHRYRIFGTADDPYAELRA